MWPRTEAPEYSRPVNMWGHQGCNMINHLAEGVPPHIYRPPRGRSRPGNMWGHPFDQVVNAIVLTLLWGVELRGPTSSSCQGLWPLAGFFFCPLGKIRAYYAVLAHFCQLLVSSSNHWTIEPLKAIPKTKKATKKNLFFNPKNPNKNPLSLTNLCSS